MGILSNERVEFESALAALLAAYGIGGGTGGGSLPATRLNIINLVKAKLDEIMPEGEGLTFSLETSPNVSNPLDLLISAILDEAAKNTLMMAPFHILEPTDAEIAAGEDLVVDDYGETGYVVLPANFLRLVSFKMEDWERPVNVPLQLTSPEYQMQKNKFIRGGVSKPAVAIAWRIGTEAPQKVLEYYSVPVESDHAIEHFLYVPETLAEDVQSNLLDTMTWIAAAKILTITGQLELGAKAMEQVALSLNNL